MSADTNDKIPYLVHNATAAPAVTDDVNAGFLCGHIWVDKTDADANNWVVYMLVSCAPGAAVWKQLTA